MLIINFLVDIRKINKNRVVAVLRICLAESYKSEIQTHHKSELNVKKDTLTRVKEMTCNKPDKQIKDTATQKIIVGISVT